MIDDYGCVAQLVEQLTLNQWVWGSNPHAPTIIKTAFRANERSFFFCDMGSNPRVRSCSVSFAFAQQLRFGHRKFNGAVQTLSVRRRNISVSIDGKQFSGLFSCLRPHAPTIMKTAFRADERSFFGVVYSVCRSDMLLSNETITMFSIKIAWLILKSKPFSNPCGCPRLKRASSLSIIS